MYLEGLESDEGLEMAHHSMQSNQADDTGDLLKNGEDMCINVENGELQRPNFMGQFNSMHIIYLES